MAFHRLPGAARRDAHRLVVVAGRAARGERVTEPEAVLGRDAVREVRERGRPLVGGNDEVRVVVVVADDVGRRHGLAADEVVGQVEEALHQDAVAGDDLLAQRVALRRRALDDEAALRAHGDDHGVLDHLRLHQAENLGAEVLAAIGPADAAARHLAAAEVDALRARRVDPDLVHRPRQGQVRDEPGVELEREVRLRPPVVCELEVVGPQRRLDEAQEAAQDPVVVEARDGVDLLLDPRGDVVRLGLAVVASRRVEPDLEEIHELAHDLGVRRQGLLHVGLAERAAGLAQVLGQGAEHGDLTPGQAGAEHEAVEPVHLDLAAPRPRERVLECLAHTVEVERAVGVGEPEVVDPRVDGPCSVDLVRALVVDLHPHVLQERKDVREQNRLPGA